MPALTPLGGHDLLVLWVQFVVLLTVARGLGYLVRLLDQPAVVGELGAGLVLGPSILGRLAPDVAAWLFPASGFQSGPILALAWFGAILLLVTTGFDTDLGLVRRLARTAALVPIGSLVVPLAVGVAAGTLMPVVFFGERADRTVFAAFMGLALSMSALPVVARILKDMGLLRRDVGQVTIFAAMADDIVGWLALGVLTGAVAGRGFAPGALATTVVVLLVFVVFLFTVGQRLTDAALRLSLQLTDGIAGALTVTLLVALAAAAITQAAGVEAVVGAFLAGIILGRSRYRKAEVLQAVELMSTAVFAPLFFATAGLYVDVGTLAEPVTAVWAAVVFVIATGSKLVGTYLGARAGGATPMAGAAMGIALNARGALGIILATVALSIGVFNQRSYTVTVLMALLTSMMVPPLLRRILNRISTGPDEAQRLQREALLSESVVAGVDSALLPTRGGRNSELAARVLDLVLKPEASVTVMTVDTRVIAVGPASDAAERIARKLAGRPIERRRRPAVDAAAAILKEAGFAYGLVAVGATEDLRTTHRLSPVIHAILAGSPVPVLLVRAGRGGARFRRLLVPATGTRIGRGAEEVAYTLAARTGAEVDVVHVISRADRMALAAWQGQPAFQLERDGLLARSLELAATFGRSATGFTRLGAATAETLLTTAAERLVDTIVLGASARALEDQAFLGHGTEYLLEHADQTLILVVFPETW